jgi:hypothetical protein
MYTFILNRYSSRIRFLHDLILVIKLLFFIYLVFSSLTFSSNYEQLLFRNVDDNAMITSITNMQMAFTNLDWSSFFYKYDYAYGWLFWMTYATFSFPAYTLTRFFPNVQIFESMHIVSNRILSMILVFITIYIIKKIIILVLGCSSDNNQLIAEILSFTLLLFPAVGYWAGRVQPSALTALLFAFSIYLLLKNSNETAANKSTLNWLPRTPIDFSFITFGALIGTKPTTIPFIPIFLVTYVVIKSKNGSVHSFKSILSSIRLVVFGAMAIGISASPSILIFPVQTLKKLLETVTYFSNNYTGGTIEISSIISTFYNGFIVQGLGAQGSFILTLIALFSLSSRKLLSRKNLHLGLITLSSLLAILFFSAKVPGNYGIMAVYLFPLIVIQLTILPILISDKLEQNFFRNTFLVLIFTSSVGLNFYQNLAAPGNQKLAINSYLVDAGSEEKQGLVSVQEKLSPEISNRRPITILQSYRSPTLLSDLRREVQTYYSFDNWAQFLTLNKVDYILVNDDDIARLALAEREFRSEEQKWRTPEIRQGNEVVDKLFLKNLFANQTCKKVKFERGNTLFACK